MDQDGSLNISYDEWRDFLLLAPSTDIHGLIKFWRHSTVSKIFFEIKNLYSTRSKFRRPAQMKANSTFLRSFNLKFIEK